MRSARLLPLLLCLASLSTRAEDGAGSSTSARKHPTAKKQSRKSVEAESTAPSSFAPACKAPSYPEPAPGESLAIDTSCGLTGAGKGAEGEQDSAKNNFCATGQPREILFKDLADLQVAVERDATINFGDHDNAGRKGPTTDRAPLQKLGEGGPVVLKAYVLIARQEGAESVNCGKNVSNGAQLHDIHISLVDSPTAKLSDECSSVVAEMSPHHRPVEWTHENVQKVANAHALVRVTGQLFFDSSHLPCKNGAPVRTNPKRTSLWEIHPIYKFEVCTEDCDRAGRWLPLDAWVREAKPAKPLQAQGTTP